MFLTRRLAPAERTREREPGPHVRGDLLDNGAYRVRNHVMEYGFWSSVIASCPLSEQSDRAPQKDDLRQLQIAATRSSVLENHGTANITSFPKSRFAFTGHA